MHIYCDAFAKERCPSIMMAKDFIGLNRTDMISIWLEPNRFEFYSVQTKPKSNRFGFNQND